MKRAKILIIRFSSFGDIVQCMGVLNSLQKTFPLGEIHWITRREYVEVLHLDKGVHKVWPYDRKSGLKGLIKITKRLKKERFNYIYDAHNNIRSTIMKIILFPVIKKLIFWQNHPHLIVRKKNRIKRFLLFKLRINLFAKPFYGMKSYLSPLQNWKVASENSTSAWKFPQEILIKTKSEVFSRLQKYMPTITIIPSAAWPMKRWPVKYWKELVLRLSHCQFIILAGPRDDFCQEIASTAPQRVFNMAGKLSLIESCAIIDRSHLFISGDTGLLHVGDILQKTDIALIGPTAFGFPSNPSVKTMEVPLNCRPCTKDGRGKCRQDIWQKCLIDITPDMVAKKIQQLF